MQSVLIAIAGWFGLSLAFGVVWTLSALALKEARRRWPQFAVDPAWRLRNRTRKHPGEAC